VADPAPRARPAVSAPGANNAQPNRVPNTGARLARTPEEQGLDPVAILERRIASGEVTLEYDDKHGWLPALMQALEVPASSQGLVFSRTSLQTDRIAPWMPRAVYFNDDVYLGWVQDGPFMEIEAIDPDEGGVFYTVNHDGASQPTFRRETTTCLICHQSRAVTGGVPGVIVRSVLVDRYGYTVASVHEGSTTDRTPLGERLGGWYVTGTHGPSGHAGNTLTAELAHEIPNVERFMAGFDMTADGNVTDLTGRFDVAPYLTGHSDVVALSVLVHQARVHNLIMMAHETAVDAVADQNARLRSLGEALPESGMLPAVRDQIDSATDRLLRAMLFVGEAPLSGPVRGTSGYAAEFASWGPRDGRGRSLRDLDLETRLFRYPLSFLIYSDAFDALPDIVLVRLYQRLGDVLAGRDTDADFAHLTPEIRSTIAEILEATKPEYAALGAR